jgi:alpha-amylase
MMRFFQARPLAGIADAGLLAGLLASLVACSSVPGGAVQAPITATSSSTAATMAAATPPKPVGFADNPIVYFVLTDRFENGNPSNDHAYGRQNDPAKFNTVQESGTFHGGDLAGLTNKLKQGYFSQLGVNAIWISAPYEQIHGWVVGGSKSFKHYSYHGYYALDYTVLDQAMGTPDELREMVDTAHAKGIRILFDVVMNHPGYADIQTLAEYKIPILWKGYEKANLNDYHSFIDYNNFEFKQWWSGDWVRAGLPGYPDGGRDDLTMQLAYLPDFRTERATPVGLPPILQRKQNTRAVTLPNTPVRGYLVKWLTDWVREYGIDGFRCDTVKHVEPESWAALKTAADAALRDWKQQHPTQKIDDAPFWMVGEVWGHSPVRSHWFDAGFDSLINFDFQSRASGNWQTLDGLYNGYASQLGKTPRTFDALSYISSHDTALFARGELKHGISALLLAPGGIQLFYGDESARAPGPSPEGDPQQATRSDMNWAKTDAALLAHTQKLGQFRARHVALARGLHLQSNQQPYAFSRVDLEHGDRVVVAPEAMGEVTLSVKNVFADGQTLHDAYGGETLVVKNGVVKVNGRGTILLEVGVK